MKTGECSSSQQQDELKSLIAADSFLHLPPPSSSACRSTNHLIFFIPGNPGLISYYHTFLSLLADPEKTESGSSASGCVIAGFSLGGFEIAGVTTDRADECQGTASLPGRGRSSPYYSLREQIELTARRMEGLVAALRGGGDSDGVGLAGHDITATGGRWKVVLVGHSVGAYIALEVLRMHRRKLAESRSADRGRVGFDIAAAILLTPTIVDIALSSSGKVLVPLLRYIPGFPLIVSLAARFITRLLPLGCLKTVVRAVMGVDTPEDAVRSTISFLNSRNGVRQSLGMAADEMEEIGEDGWGEEVWGVVEAGKKDSEVEGGKVSEPAELIFYFANRDHWVADQTREMIISTRGGKGGAKGPKMIVAEANELVHGWCIRQNGIVAQRVDGWVKEILERNSNVLWGSRL